MNALDGQSPVDRPGSPVMNALDGQSPVTSPGARSWMPSTGKAR